MSGQRIVRDHSGSKPRFDWQKWRANLALIVVVGSALVFLFFTFRPAVEAWGDGAWAPIAAMFGSKQKLSSFEKPVALVGTLTREQNSAIESWEELQKKHMSTDVFLWNPVRGPYPLTSDYQLSLDVQVIWHRTGSLQTQHQVCRLTLQEYSNRSWTVINAVPGKVCDYTAVQ